MRIATVRQAIVLRISAVGESIIGTPSTGVRNISRTRKTDGRSHRRNAWIASCRSAGRKPRRSVATGNRSRSRADRWLSYDSAEPALASQQRFGVGTGIVANRIDDYARLFNCIYVVAVA